MLAFRLIPDVAGCTKNGIYHINHMQLPNRVCNFMERASKPVQH